MEKNRARATLDGVSVTVYTHGMSEKKLRQTVAERELAIRLADVTEAMKVIGTVAVDAEITPKKRLERILGILRLYDCAPAKKVTPAQAAAQPVLPALSDDVPPAPEPEAAPEILLEDIPF